LINNTIKSKGTNLTFNDRKHRSNRLGFDEKRFEELSVETKRMDELEELREPARDIQSRSIERPDDRNEHENESRNGNEPEERDMNDDRNTNDPN
jgi:hypothetical protein